MAPNLKEAEYWGSMSFWGSRLIENNRNNYLRPVLLRIHKKDTEVRPGLRKLSELIVKGSIPPSLIQKWNGTMFVNLIKK